MSTKKQAANSSWDLELQIDGKAGSVCVCALIPVGKDKTGEDAENGGLF